MYNHNSNNTLYLDTVDNIFDSNLPHLTLGSPLIPSGHAQNGSPVSKTTWHMALIPLQTCFSHGSSLEII